MPPQKDRFVNFIVGPAKAGQNHHEQDGEVCMTGVRMYTKKSTPCNRLAIAIAVIAVSLVLILTACLLVTLLARQNSQCANGKTSAAGNSDYEEVPVSGSPKPEASNDELTSTLADNSTVSDDHLRSFRLPLTLKPFLYELELRTDISGNSFAGAVLIHFQCRSPTRFIVLHVSDLDIDSIELDKAGRQDGASTTPKLTDEPEFYLPFDFMTLALDGPLKKGHSYTLKIRYQAQFSSTLVGLYVSNYEATHGKTK